MTCLDSVAHSIVGKTLNEVKYLILVHTTVFLISPIMQMWKLRIEEVKSLAFKGTRKALRFF